LTVSYGFVSIKRPLEQSAFELQLDLHAVLSAAITGAFAHVPLAVHCDSMRAVDTEIPFLSNFLIFVLLFFFQNNVVLE
jgi:hypothetical protein